MDMHNKPLLPEERIQRTESQLNNGVPTLRESEPEQPGVPRRRVLQGRAATVSTKTEQGEGNVTEPLLQSHESHANFKNHLWKPASVFITYIMGLTALLIGLDHAIRLWLAFKAVRYRNVLHLLVSRPYLIPQASGLVI